MLIFTNFVPISLLVGLEVVKFLQAAFISCDVHVTDPRPEGIVYARAQTSNLNEALGQVEYVFSDKTGTLTCNVMAFRRLCVGTTSFGLAGEAAVPPEITNVNFVDPYLFEQLNNRSHPKHDETVNVVLHLALCHTIIVEKHPSRLIYNASSPDELALVNAARYFDAVFEGRDEEENMVVRLFGERLKFTLLNVIEFTSDRKRMTVVVETPDN